MIVALCYLSQTNIRNGTDTNGITMNSASSISVYMVLFPIDDNIGTHNYTL